MINDFANDFICGTNLRDVADYIWGVESKDSIFESPKTQVIWCKTDLIPDLFTHIRTQPLTSKFVLITHCSDYAINEKVFNAKPPNIIKWFAQNVDYKHEDLVPLPIGIENNQGAYKGKYTDFVYLFENIKPLEISNKIINQVYCNFNPRNYPSRPHIAQQLHSNNLAHFEGTLPYNEYIENMKQYLFIASPRGNGIDCHRTWEALYTGCIPIVDKHFMYDTYKNLPIIQIDNWSRVTPELLHKYTIKYKNKELFTNIEELTLKYWINKIREATNDRPNQLRDGNPRKEDS